MLEINSVITTKVGQRGQITIPSKIRRQIGLREGDRIAVLLQEGQVIILPITQSLLDLRGSVSVNNVQDFDDVRRQVKEGRAKKLVSDES